MSTSAVNSGTASSVFAAINAANTSSSTASATPSAASSAQDTFLKLLTSQLQNQDPLNPMDNAQMTSQLAQISTVDGITNLNATVQSLLNNSTSSQTLQAAALIGKTVLVPGSALALQQGQAIGGVDMASAADDVVATITDSNGLTVRKLDLGALPAGTTNFSWDGATNSGAVAADGNYSVSFAAKQGGNAVTATALSLGAVTSVAQNAQGVSLTVGNLGMFNLSDVQQIF